MIPENEVQELRDAVQEAPEMVIETTLSEIEGDDMEVLIEKVKMMAVLYGVNFLRLVDIHGDAPHEVRGTDFVLIIQEHFQPRVYLALLERYLKQLVPPRAERLVLCLRFEGFARRVASGHLELGEGVRGTCGGRR